MTNNVYASATSLHLTNPDNSFNLNQTAEIPQKDNIALQNVGNAPHVLAPTIPENAFMIFQWLKKYHLIIKS